MTIRQLPVSPSRDRPAQFSQEMDAMLAALPGFVDDANALEQSLQLVATNGTSASTLTIGTGTKTLTTQPGKAWVTGAWVYVFCASAVTNLMVGQVTSYNAETGVLQINAQQVDGGGTFSSWVIGLSVPQVAWAKPGVNSDITALTALSVVPEVLRPSGIFPWSDERNYTTTTLVWGSDGMLYKCLVPSGPSTTPRDPLTAPLGYWGQVPVASGDTGDVKYTSRATPPPGWLKANGAAVSRATYASLFSVIGTGYGAGDGASTFNLPDLRGIFMRGLDDGRGIDPGRALGSYQDHQSNSLAAVDQNSQVNAGGGQNVPTDGNYTGWISTGEEGVQPNQALRFRLAGVETRPRNVALLAVIKY